MGTLSATPQEKASSTGQGLCFVHGHIATLLNKQKDERGLFVDRHPNGLSYKEVRATCLL